MMQYWNYGPGYNMFNSGFSIFGLILNILFWGLIIMLIIRLFKSHHCCGHDEMEHTDDENRSLEIVKERYAKGEIDKKEFEQLKKDLA